MDPNPLNMSLATADTGTHQAFEALDAAGSKESVVAALGALTEALMQGGMYMYLDVQYTMASTMASRLIIIRFFSFFLLSLYSFFPS